MTGGGWQKPSKCANSECAEIRPDPGGDGVEMRSSKEPAHILWLDAAEWRDFIAAAKAGQYDRLAAPR